MTSKASPLLKPEVAKDGVVRIPSTTTVDRPWASLPPAAASTKAPSGQITAIKRLDGTIDTNLGSKIMPNNPNFAPRKAWPGGNIVVSNKDEALIKYYERKGLDVPPELQKKKEELDAAAKEKKAAVFSRLGSKGAGKGGGGKVVKLGGAEGAFDRLGSGSGIAAAAAGLPKSKKFSVPAEEEAPAAARPPRPKGGVKMLGGTEGAVRGEKRPAEDAAEVEAKRPAT